MLVELAQEAAEISAKSSALVAKIAALASDGASSAPTLVAVTNDALEPYRLGVTLVRQAIDRGELRGILGSRRRLHVDAAELIAWRDSRPVAPRPPRKSREIARENEDPIDAMLRHGELVATRGGR